MRFMILLMLPVLIMSSCARDEHETSGRRLELPDGFDQATQTVSADEMLTDISFLAADELEGRLPGSDGDRKARLYLAQRLAAMGFEPFFDGSFEQKVDIVGLTSHMPEHWIFKGPRASEASRKLLGTKLRASSARLQTVGSAMIPRIRLPVKAHSPVGKFNRSCRNGATITIPKKP